jgi:hypothetical protein
MSWARQAAATIAPKSPGFDVLQFMAGDDFAADQRPERAPDAAGFKAVRQPGAHIIAFRQRKDLRLVLHPPEGGGEDDAVVVLLEGGALRITRRLAGARPFGGQQHATRVERESMEFDVVIVGGGPWPGLAAAIR